MPHARLFFLEQRLKEKGERGNAEVEARGEGGAQLPRGGGARGAGPAPSPLHTRVGGWGRGGRKWEKRGRRTRGAKAQCEGRRKRHGALGAASSVPIGAHKDAKSEGAFRSACSGRICSAEANVTPPPPPTFPATSPLPLLPTAQVSPPLALSPLALSSRFVPPPSPSLFPASLSALLSVCVGLLSVFAFSIVSNFLDEIAAVREGVPGAAAAALGNNQPFCPGARVDRARRAVAALLARKVHLHGASRRTAQRARRTFRRQHRAQDLRPGALPVRPGTGDPIRAVPRPGLHGGRVRVGPSRRRGAVAAVAAVADVARAASPGTVRRKKLVGILAKRVRYGRRRRRPGRARRRRWRERVTRRSRRDHPGRPPIAKTEARRPSRARGSGVRRRGGAHPRGRPCRAERDVHENAARQNGHGKARGRVRRRAHAGKRGTQWGRRRRRPRARACVGGGGSEAREAVRGRGQGRRWER